MSGGPRYAAPPPGTRNAIATSRYTWKCFDVIACVGPRQTEMMSTNGMTSATSTTQDSASKSRRNAKPANTAAKNFAKFAGRPQSTAVKTNASTASTTTAIQSRG